jgi:hypothetical protein
MSNDSQAANVHPGARTSWRTWKAQRPMSQIKDPHARTDSRALLDEVGPSTEAGAALQLAGRSCCCCSAAPAFTVIITSKVPVRHSVDVLMCGHHYRQCASALTSLTPLVFDRDGYLVLPAVTL